MPVTTEYQPTATLLFQHLKAETYRLLSTLQLQEKELIYLPYSVSLLDAQLRVWRGIVRREVELLDQAAVKLTGWSLIAPTTTPPKTWGILGLTMSGLWTRVKTSYPLRLLWRTAPTRETVTPCYIPACRLAELAIRDRDRTVVSAETLRVDSLLIKCPIANAAVMLTATPANVNTSYLTLKREENRLVRPEKKLSNSLKMLTGRSKGVRVRSNGFIFKKIGG